MIHTHSHPTSTQPQPVTVCTARVQRAACHTGRQNHPRSCRCSSRPRGALCGHTKERSARSARTRADPTLPKARAPTPRRRVDRARAGLGRVLPARTGEPTAHTRRRGAPLSTPRPPRRSRRGLEAARGGAGRQAGRSAWRCTRAPLAREFGLGRPIDLRCAGWWAADERYVGAGAEGWGCEGCGRPTERDARATMLSIDVRRKRPLATSRRRRAACPPTPPGARA